jgi:hypothetical protein
LLLVLLTYKAGLSKDLLLLLLLLVVVVLVAVTHSELSLLSQQWLQLQHFNLLLRQLLQELLPAHHRQTPRAPLWTPPGLLLLPMLCLGCW